MKYLLDTSTIAVLLARYKEKALDILKKCATLDLAFYELGNIVWKEYALFKRITLEEALSRASEAYTIIQTMKVYSITKPEEYREIMSTAVTLKITFYDSAFLTISKINNFKLVTQDRELLEKAPNTGIKVISIGEFLSEIGGFP